LPGEPPGGPRAAPRAATDTALGDGTFDRAAVDDGGAIETRDADIPALRPAGPAPIAVVAVGVFALGLLAAAVGRREVDVARGETVLFEGRPRRSLLRYALSLGSWELVRRSTSFTVTERRVIVDRGILFRRTRSIPLSGIVGIDVVAGAFEGVVRIASRGQGTAPAEELGPLRAPVARGVAATIAAAIAHR
jgi:membrane protein YdbS with pleckstrin-like domain